MIPYFHYPTQDVNIATQTQEFSAWKLFGKEYRNDLSIKSFNDAKNNIE